MTWKFIRQYRCPIIKKLKTMVTRSINQKLRLRTFDARNERLERGAVVTNRRGQRGVGSPSIPTRHAVPEWGGGGLLQQRRNPHARSATHGSGPRFSAQPQHIQSTHVTQH